MVEVGHDHNSPRAGAEFLCIVVLMEDRTASLLPDHRPPLFQHLHVLERFIGFF